MRFLKNAVAIAAVIVPALFASAPEIAVGGVQQNIGICDTKFDTLARPDCLVCHVSDTVLVTRHHVLIASEGKQCLDCHTQVPDGVSGYTFAEYRVCETCHGTAPHHSLAQATARDCGYCHGAVVDKYDISEPWARPTVVLINGRCDTCHISDAAAVDPVTGMPRPISSPSVTHHATGFQDCNMCHDGSWNQYTQIYTCNDCHGVTSLHNLQVDSSSTGTVGTTVYGAEDPGFGHVGHSSDCYGCHEYFVRETRNPYTTTITPWIEKLSTAVAAADTRIDLTISGTSFVSDITGALYPWEETRTVIHPPTVDVNGTNYTPISYTNRSITIAIPRLPVGNYDVRVVKNGKMSNKATFSVKPILKVSSVTVGGGKATFSGTGFGPAPLPNTKTAQKVVIGGVEATVASWSDTKIIVSMPTAIASRSLFTINTLFGPVSGTMKK